ncbi:hypothetical protein [Deinococcus soli (ex Cha et al. 2016)]|uniref:hypothetical protein n=1 Tax=Deinococcus soli (ex Cha et al. 2016) TaxID=1309411 RepID=UPI00199676A4|nr:hypothetical protein [Deinococcus soli (ex Cha et al. 2016)]GGB58835.1 hypothetical protein GCM10008019_13450 [Deinococcus soli (ex Cha et al. 2016)]
MLGFLIVIVLLAAAAFAWRVTRRAAPPQAPRVPEPAAPLPAGDVRPTAPTLVMPAEGGELLHDAQSEMLADVSPEELQRLMAAVPRDVMGRAIGQEDLTSHAPVTAEQRQELQGLGSALDDLDFWNMDGDQKDPPKA